MRRLVLGLLLLSGTALACDKIEYAEAKDWTPQELQTQACEALKGLLTSMKQYNEASKGRDSLDPVAMVHFNEGTVCRKQHELYVRILKNIHHKELKTCV